MISKTLGQLTQDETRLWEMVFCIETTNFRNVICEDMADNAIRALRQYRAESAPKPPVALGTVALQDGATMVLWTGAPSEEQMADAHADPRDPPHEEDTQTPLALLTEYARLVLDYQDEAAPEVEPARKAILDMLTPPANPSGIIGTYDTLNKGWWLNGPTIPRFEPDPRFDPMSGEERP